MPFHWHGPGFAEVIHGRKVSLSLSYRRSFSASDFPDCPLVLRQRWFFYPPHQEPHFDPNRTTLSWLTDTYPHLPREEAPLECTIRPGEVNTAVSSSAHMTKRSHDRKYSENPSERF